MNDLSSVNTRFATTLLGSNNSCSWRANDERQKAESYSSDGRHYLALRDGYIGREITSVLEVTEFFPSVPS